MIELEFRSRLKASRADVWSWISSVKGMATEMKPYFKMTIPNGMTHLRPDQVTLGKPLFKSWLLLGGVVPFDYSFLTLIELEEGPGVC